MHHYRGLVYDSAKSRLEQKIERLKRRRPPIFRTASNFVKMTLVILVSLAACFSIELILCSTITILECKNVRARSFVPGYDYRWEKIAGIFIGIISICLGITGIVAVAMVLHSREETSYWLDAVIMFNL